MKGEKINISVSTVRDIKVSAVFGAANIGAQVLLNNECYKIVQITHPRTRSSASRDLVTLLVNIWTGERLYYTLKNNNANRKEPVILLYAYASLSFYLHAGKARKLSVVIDA